MLQLVLCFYFLIFTCSLPMYKNAIDFLKNVILYSLTFPNSLIPESYIGFGVFTQSYANSNYFFFPNLYAFISLLMGSCFLRTFNSMLNINVQITQPYFIPNLREKAFSFSPLSVILTIEFFGNHLSWKCSSLPSFLRMFIMSGC